MTTDVFQDDCGRWYWMAGAGKWTATGHAYSRHWSAVRGLQRFLQRVKAK